MYDPQDARPVCYCGRCGHEIYNRDQDLCDHCKEEIEGVDGLLAYCKAYPKRLLSFLCNEKGEDYMKEIHAAMREFFGGDSPDGPDYDSWVRS